MFDVRSH